MHSLLVGFGLGLFVALQLGPMSLFLVRSTLRVGLRAGTAGGARCSWRTPWRASA